jgi:hypothetical protein
VGRGLLGCASALAIGGCVGQNPWWDPPVNDVAEGTVSDTGGESTVGDRGGGTGSSTSGSSTMIANSCDESVDAESGTAESSDERGADSTDGAPMDDGAPPCEPPYAMCDGECRDVRSDHHHCGVQCIDCMDLHGPGTHCVDSMCDVDDD